jgi:mRNA interferase RelE/StbE
MMPKLDGLQSVLDYLARLQPKIASQIARKAMSLAITPLPPDARPLEGYPGHLRVDAGEHRIVYGFHENDDFVELVLVSKRNDDEVHRRLRRIVK